MCEVGMFLPGSKQVDGMNGEFPHLYHTGEFPSYIQAVCDWIGVLCDVLHCIHDNEDCCVRGKLCAWLGGLTTYSGKWGKVTRFHVPQNKYVWNMIELKCL